MFPSSQTDGRLPGQSSTAAQRGVILRLEKEGLTADVDEQVDGAGAGCRLGFAQCQGSVPLTVAVSRVSSMWTLSVIR
jgi:hypothetical protein